MIFLSSKTLLYKIYFYIELGENDKIIQNEVELLQTLWNKHRLTLNTFLVPPKKSADISWSGYEIQV